MRGREGGRERGREGGRERGREGGKEGRRERATHLECEFMRVAAVWRRPDPFARIAYT